MTERDWREILLLAVSAEQLRAPIFRRGVEGAGDIQCVTRIGVVDAQPAGGMLHSQRRALCVMEIGRRQHQRRRAAFDNARAKRNFLFANP